MAQNFAPILTAAPHFGQVRGSPDPVEVFVVGCIGGGTGAGGVGLSKGGRSGAAFFGAALVGAAVVDIGVGGGDMFGVSGTEASSEGDPFGK